MMVCRFAISRRDAMRFLMDLRCWLVVGSMALAAVISDSTSVAEDASPRLATVNKHAISQRDIDLELLVSGVREATEGEREAALERVIDRTLVADFIATKGADPLAEDVEERVLYVRTGIEGGGETVEAVLGKLNLTEEDVRHFARSSVSWKAYVRRTVTGPEIREHFEQHRERFDGTRVRIRQIVRTIPSRETPTEWVEAEKLLADLRSQIESGKIEFAAAAMAQSQSPAAKSGGDLGFIRYQGDVPAPVAAAAFALPVGETSQPLRSSVGVHLVQVTERQPGDLSLEDVRPFILQELGQQLWVKTVKTLRQKAKITRR